MNLQRIKQLIITINFYKTMKSLKYFLLSLLLAVSASAFAQLPSVKLKNIDGKVVNTANLSNGGKPFVISFFATWCKPCLRELKAIHEVYPDWQAETGVKLIAVSIDQAQNANKVKPLVDSEEWEYEVLLDPNSDFMRAMNVRNVPHLFIIDGEGNIAYSHSGYTDGGEKEVLAKIKEISAKGKKSGAKKAAGKKAKGSGCGNCGGCSKKK